MFTSIYQWIVGHPTVVSLAFYHFASAFVGSLEMPDATSSKLYRFLFRLTNRLAANYARAGQQAAAKMPDDITKNGGVFVPVQTPPKDGVPSDPSKGGKP
jgi:hypothetical protein